MPHSLNHYGPRYVDRGDPGQYDLQVGNFIKDGAWHDLSLSTIVPAGAVAVTILLSIQTNAAGRELFIRKRGNVNSATAPALKSQVANMTVYAQLTVACDANRVIQYKADNVAWAIINATVQAWFT